MIFKLSPKQKTENIGRREREKWEETWRDASSLRVSLFPAKSGDLSYLHLAWSVFIREDAFWEQGRCVF